MASLSQVTKSPRRMSVARGRRMSNASSIITSKEIKITEKRPDTKLSRRESEVAFNPRAEKQETFSFAYSAYIEKAFKRQFRCTLFGPPSAAVSSKRKGPMLQIENIDGLYSDFVYINELLLHNKKFALQLQKELTAEDEEVGKLVKLPKIHRGRKTRSRENSVSIARTSSPNFTKLPSISSSTTTSYTTGLSSSEALSAG